MAKGLKKLWDALLEPSDYPEQEELEYNEEAANSYKEPEPEPEPRRQSVSRRSQSAGIVNLPGAATNKMIVYRPVSYEDTQNIIDNLKNRKPVIVNMEQIEVETAQRILDFMSGACYAVDGRVYKVSSRIFIVAPANIDIIGSSDGFRE
ncbi:MAG: cell division protein SepF [Clostridia bacterium]|nr:cell division protein SepF [Clostridia bacterium]MBQ2111566.1 cell division protein SepF [Clostridia bacterium]MBQ3939226.1 cell division protein SepF [Clostridia bacterium]MBQ5488572.1 cell division protein SepF [Clostridia bacterium]MBR4634997.1 cell division protein SepF [Clostridia bacterium]